MDTGLSPFRMELVLTEFYVARGGPVLRPSMKCTVHESRAHLNGEEGRLMVLLLLLLHAVHIAQYWENQSLADRPIASRTKRRRPSVARFEWFAMSRFVRRSIFSPLSLSSFFLVFPYRVWTTYIYTYTYAILRSLSPLLPLPFYHFPLSFSSFSPIICLCFFLSLSPLPSRRANLLLCLSQSYIAWSLFSFHWSLLIAKCRNILLPELFSSRSPNQLSRGGIARVVLCALSRGPCWSNWISRLARRSPPIPPIFSLCFCLSSPVLPL